MFISLQNAMHFCTTSTNQKKCPFKLKLMKIKKDQILDLMVHIPKNYLKLQLSICSGGVRLHVAALQLSSSCFEVALHQIKTFCWENNLGCSHKAALSVDPSPAPQERGFPCLQSPPSRHAGLSTGASGLPDSHHRV